MTEVKILNHEWRPVVSGDVFVDPLASDAIDPTKVLLLESSYDVLCKRFQKPTKYHGRSIEDNNRLVIGADELTDENGALFTTFTIKGAEAHLPYASYSMIDANQVRVNGMLDASTFDRCQQVSRHLRAAGVLTEWPIFHARPKTFPDGEGDIPLHAFRRMLYDNFLDYQEALRKREPHIAASVGRVGLVGGALSEMQFGVMYRAMLSGTRIQELSTLKAEGTMEAHVAAAIRSLQKRQPTHFAAWEALERLDPESPEDQLNYLEQVLPSIMGENLARFHSAGCYHKYLHAGNWTLSGEIVDLDSVRHEMFGDEDKTEITFANQLDDTSTMDRALIRINNIAEISPSHFRMFFQHTYHLARRADPMLTEPQAGVLNALFAWDAEQGKVLVDYAEPEFTKLVVEAIRNITQTSESSEILIESLVGSLKAAGIRAYIYERIGNFLSDVGFADADLSEVIDLCYHFEEVRFVTSVTDELINKLEERAARQQS